MRLVAYFFVFSLFASGLKIAEARDLNPMPISPNYFIEYSPIYTEKIESSLQGAINYRLGMPYLWAGTDDRGYDCSGFVWRVFQEAGINFDRTSTRILWQRLPEATQEEYARFGTLVFFGGPQGLDHVGIVNDADSFYHASNSQGVTQSYFDSSDKYWRSRIIGYRRIFAPIRRRAAPGRR
jgi:hypothetical protein